MSLYLLNITPVTKNTAWQFEKWNTMIELQVKIWLFFILRVNQLYDNLNYWKRLKKLSSKQNCMFPNNHMYTHEWIIVFLTFFSSGVILLFYGSDKFRPRVSKPKSMNWFIFYNTYMWWFYRWFLLWKTVYGHKIHTLKLRKKKYFTYVQLSIKNIRQNNEATSQPQASLTSASS